MNHCSEENNQTKVIVIQPERIEVPLVPLNKLEKAEDKYLWFTIFISIATCMMGLTFPSFSSSSNLFESRYILLFTTILFFTFSFIFGIQTIRNRKILYENAKSKDESKEIKDNEKIEKIPEKLKIIIKNSIIDHELLSTFDFIFQKYPIKSFPLVIDFIKRSNYQEHNLKNCSFSIYEWLVGRICEITGFRRSLSNTDPKVFLQFLFDNIKEFGGLNKKDLQEKQLKRVLQRLGS